MKDGPTHPHGVSNIHKYVGQWKGLWKKDVIRLSKLESKLRYAQEIPNSLSHTHDQSCSHGLCEERWIATHFQPMRAFRKWWSTCPYKLIIMHNGYTKDLDGRLGRLGLKIQKYQSTIKYWTILHHNNIDILLMKTSVVYTLRCSLLIRREPLI